MAGDTGWPSTAQAVAPTADTGQRGTTVITQYGEVSDPLLAITSHDPRPAELNHASVDVGPTWTAPVISVHVAFPAAGNARAIDPSAARPTRLAFLRRDGTASQLCTRGRAAGSLRNIASLC